MASFTYNIGSLKHADRTLDFAADTIEVVIVKASYVPNKDDTGATPAASEITGVSGYVGGFGGAGRKVLAGKSIASDTALDRTGFFATNPSAYTIGAGDTIGGFVVQKKGSASDATAIPLFFLDVVDFATNGIAFQLSFDASGVGYIQQ